MLIPGLLASARLYAQQIPALWRSGAVTVADHTRDDSMAAIARRTLERCRLFALAESLGGVESLIEHPGIMTHSSLPAATRESLGISDGLIRLSVGVEDVQDLIAELRQALS